MTSDTTTVARRLSVRARMVAAVVALTAATLVISGLVAARIQDSEVAAAIDEDLRTDAGELVALVASGADPATGAAFDEPRTVVRHALERAVPEPYEGLVGFVDGDLAFVVDEADVRLDADAELLEAVAPLTLAVGQRVVGVSTSVTSYRVAVTAVGTGVDGTLVTDPSAALAPGSEVAAQVLAYDERALLARFDRAFTIYAWVAMATLALAAVAAWMIAGRLLSPIRVLARTARSIGRDDLSERIPVTGRDDLADMTAAVNGMLERIEAAFESQTRLLDDVSHELRTPLTIVHGHLELMDPADPRDAADARAVSLDELQRMSRLVDDLLTLATSARPGFLSTSVIDVHDLTDGVLARCRAWEGRRWTTEAVADATVVGDRDRLTQAWLQLAANAVRYSADGSEIAIGSALDGTYARLWVRDHGAGVDPAVLPTLFERHAQARRGDGLGLGLEIVHRIVTAHGGTIEVESALGRGSTFAMVVPLEGPRETEAS